MLRSALAIGLGLFGNLAIAGMTLAVDDRTGDYKGVYEGTIGPARVVAELTDTSGTYFYASKGVDIFLTLVAKANRVEVLEKSTDDDEAVVPTGLWSLTSDGSRLTGTWSAPKGGKTLPITLTRVGGLEPRSQERSDQPGASLAYGQRWIAARLRWTLGPEIPLGDLSYAVAKDSIFSTQMPRLVRFPDEERKRKINEAIDKLQVDKILDTRETSVFLRQSNAAREGKSFNAVAEANPEFGQNLRVTKLTPEALSFLIEGVLDGGGAHPNTYVAAYTINLLRAKPVEGTLVGANDEKQGKVFDGALDIARADKRKAFDSFWVAKLRAALPKREAGKNDEDDDPNVACAEDIMAPEFIDGPGSVYYLYLTEGGLAVHPAGWPNVSAYCYTEFKPVPVVLTRQDVQPFLAPGSALIGLK